MTIETNRHQVFGETPEDGIRFVPDEPGVYCILNRINGRRYVGRTATSMQQRCRLHRSALRSGVGGNWMMLRDAKEQGIEAFFYFAMNLTIAPGTRGLDFHLDQVEVWLTRQLYSHDERYGYNSEAGHHRSKAARFRDRERKLLKSARGKYKLLPGVDLRDPINPVMLASWLPGS